VQPNLGYGRVEFVPQVPQGQTSVRGQHIRLGGGSADVLGTHTGNKYRTEIKTTKGVGADTVVIGHTLSHGANPVTVTLDGHAVHNYQVRETNRGTEVTVSTTGGHHRLTITV
jgi:hypothetical protein